MLGWKEFELEVMRDRADNAVVVCSIENVDPMGVHTGDSVTVAPQMTLSDREYQDMRDDALTVLRAVGVETGGANVQFAVDPRTGRRVVIEMNPRVSRSSALASKATGFPIAKVAAQLAVGFTLDEIRNEVTGKTAAAFEPTLDYVVVKVPRFNFEKFPGADPELTTRMKSVGEVMAIGRTFPEALQKACRSLETGRDGLGDPDRRPGARHAPAPPPRPCWPPAPGRPPTGWRRSSGPCGSAARSTRWPPPPTSTPGSWTGSPASSRSGPRSPRAASIDDLGRGLLWRAKRHGFSDPQLAAAVGATEGEVRTRRRALGVEPVYRSVDTCAGEFEASTPYHYSTYEEETEVPATGRRRVVVLGSGPNRIGQGVEFDTACVHAVQALREAGYETVMVNCNPETVSTDYDIADRLYIEPLTCEDVLEVCRAEAAGGDLVGVIVTMGGQTPLQLAQGLAAAGVPLLGTPPDAIDLAEDRGRFGTVLEQCGLDAPPWGQAATVDQALAVADRVGYPVLVRPSYVLGGRSMEVCYDADGLARSSALAAIGGTGDRPVLVDRFLEDAVEVDVDALCDAAGQVLVCGVMEHIEEAGIHSGDSACVLPPITLGADQVAAVEEATARLGRALGVVGILNVQFAFKGQRLYVLEANPRASRSVPFVEKVTGLPVAKAAALADDRLDPGRPGPRGDRAGPRRGQGGGAAVRPLPRGRLAARPRDALHRRGAGDRRPLRGRVRQEPGGRLRGPAGQGGGLPVGPQRRQAGHRAAGQAPRRPRLHPGRDHRHGRGPAPQRDGRRGRPQGPRGARQRGRQDPGRGDRPGRQHPGRPGGPGGRLRHPDRRRRRRHPLHHHPLRPHRRRPGHRGPPGRRPDRPPPPGLARRPSRQAVRSFPTGGARP